MIHEQVPWGCDQLPCPLEPSKTFVMGSIFILMGMTYTLVYPTLERGLKLNLEDIMKKRF